MSQFKIEHPDLGENTLILSIPKLFGSHKILYNGREIFQQKDTYSLSDQLGKPFRIELKMRYLDPAPKVLINDKEIEAVKPFQWYEYVWVGFPIFLIFQGGLLGLLVGFFAMRLNSSVFRSNKAIFLKYFFTFLISVGVFIFYFIIASIVMEMIEHNS